MSSDKFALISQGLVTSKELADYEGSTIETINRNLSKAGVGWLPFKGKDRLWSLPHIRDVIKQRRNLFDEEDTGDED